MARPASGPVVRQPGRGRLARGPSSTAPCPLLQQAGLAAQATGGLLVHPHLHQSPGRAAPRARRTAADQHHPVPFRTEQPPYSVFVRGAEAGALPVAGKYGLGALTWSPLNSGWLTGRFRRGEPVELTAFRKAVAWKFDLSLPGNQRKLDAVEQLRAVAEEAGVSLTHLALAFAASHRAVTSVILGPGTAGHLDDQLAAADVRIDDHILDRIDEIVPPGTNLNPPYTDYTPPALADAGQRRRAACLTESGPSRAVLPDGDSRPGKPSLPTSLDAMKGRGPVPRGCPG
ncbi:aldo/keto reductase [Streptomyces mirabilis]|uniref:aldo/keto reductase n=1 Tax=Streptomyces mirabilis TaxID=68239 RepID=UPI00367ED345